MTKYRMDEGFSIVNTEKATASWQEGRRWDGSNWISLATGSQFLHQTLYRSRKGRYYLEHTSDWHGSRSSAEWVSAKAAVRWLLANEHEDIPEELQQHVDAVEE